MILVFPPLRARLAERAAFSSQSDFLVAWGFSLKLFLKIASSLARISLTFSFKPFFVKLFKFIYASHLHCLKTFIPSLSLSLSRIALPKTHKKFRFILPRTHISAIAVNRSTTLTQIRFQCSNYMARREVIITHRLCGYVCDYAFTKRGREKSTHSNGFLLNLAFLAARNFR